MARAPAAERDSAEDSQKRERSNTRWHVRESTSDWVGVRKSACAHEREREKRKERKRARAR